jgi:hypothetical protein
MKIIILGGNTVKVKTPEEIATEKKNYNSRKKKWRDEHPKEWALIVLKSHLKKVFKIAKKYAIDLAEIQNELAQAELKE